MDAVFWTSAALVFYVYAGYPAVLAVWARLCPRRRAEASLSGDRAWPGVSIVVAVRNEARRLPARIDNLLSLDYPGDRQIIVASDGSTDDPSSALRPFPDVELIEGPLRGKAAALNAGVARARHDIVVFADARQAFARDALRALVAPFADPRVGAVTGELILENAGAGEPGVAEGVGLYWRYEKHLRRLESVVGSVLGATGAIYAMRRELWQPLPDDTILDDVLGPMRAVFAGRTVVFEGRARAFDRAPEDPAVEARRKIRTLAGNVQILWLEPRLLIPVVNPVWLQYMSHKVGRLLVPYALVALLVSSAALASRHVIYAAALALQAAFYLLAAYGAWLARQTLPAPAEVRHARDAR